jgi:ComF family protein
MIARLGREVARGLRQLIYPAVCASCGNPLPDDQGCFCLSCRQALTWEPSRTCPWCASPVGEFAQLDGGCVRCRKEDFRFDSAFRLGPYDGALRDAILRIKFGRDETLGEALGRLWAEHCEQRFKAINADVVIPIPLHWRRRWRRGFNQAALVAEPVADRLGLPCRSKWLRRPRHTEPQSQQSPTARRENLRGAFRISSHADLRGKTILLIDDVLTTGTTASEAAATLKTGGASRVAVAVLAHR